MSDDELEKLAAAMKNVSPSKASRKSGMEAAMSAFDAEFAAENASQKETASEKTSTPTQGLAAAPRPTGQTTRDRRVQTLGRDAMSKIKDIFSFNGKAAMMMGSCAAALFAVSLYVPNMTFEDMPTASEAITSEVKVNDKIGALETDIGAEESITVTSKRANVPEPVEQEKPAAVQGVIPSFSPPPVEARKDTAERAAPPAQPAPQAQGGINSINDLLNQVRSDSDKVESENRDIEAKFRQREVEQAGLLAPMDTEADIAIKEYRAVLQQIDNPSLFAEQTAVANGYVNDTGAPKIDSQSFKIQVSDRDVQPLVRIPPIMPARAETSGHCRLRYEVSPEGVPLNVVATKCTDSVFEIASIKSVKKWKYRPKIVNGRPVTRSGVETKVRFRLMDEYGNIIPEDDSFEQFEDFETNPVTSVEETPVSTFSVDVDTASYSFFRSSINRGQLPPRSSIRLEEMINYFPYDYAAPRSADQPFKANVTVTPNPWNADTKLMHIGIKGYVPPKAERPRSNIVFLIDTSGSMNQTNKLPLLISSFKLLLNTLDEDDTVSIVTYAGRAGTVLEPTPASETDKIKDALTRLRAGGSTAGAAGLELAYNKAMESFDEDGVNRVILATDGDFNVGFSSHEEMKTFIEKKRETGIFLSVLGFGNGNYNDQLMQALAQNGNGVAAYIDNLAEANKVLANEAGSALLTIAKDVKIQVEFNPDTISEYRLIGYETRALRREDFNNDKVDAGEINAGHTVTAIYEMTPVGSPARMNDPLRYVTEKLGGGTNGSDEFAFVKIRHKLPNADTSTLQTFPIGPKLERSLGRASDDMRFATAVAAVGQKLRGDTQLENFSYAEAIELASGAKGEDKNGYRAEFIQLTRLAEGLSE